MAKKTPVDVQTQIIFCLIPYLWIYALYRIEKLQKAFFVIIGTIVVGIGLYWALPFLEWLFAVIFLPAIFQLFLFIFIFRWSRKWNMQFSKGGISFSSITLDLLKERYEKGEITKEEFDKFKEDLS